MNNRRVAAPVSPLLKMWNTTHKDIPRAHRIDVALQALEQAQADVFEEEGPGDFSSALDELCAYQSGVEIHARRFQEAMENPSFSPDVRFEAVGQALRLIRVQFGR